MQINNDIDTVNTSIWTYSQYECDTYFPDINFNFNHTYKSIPFEENNTTYTMNVYSHKYYDSIVFGEYKQKQMDKCLEAINKL